MCSRVRALRSVVSQTTPRSVVTSPLPVAGATVTQSYEAKAHPFRGGMKPTASETVLLSVVTPSPRYGYVPLAGGEMKPVIPAWGRTGTAHDPTVGAWGPVRRGVPGLWPGTPRVQSCEDVRSTNRSSPSGAWRRYIPRVSSPVSAARSTIRRRQQVGVGDSESTSPEIEDFWCADESQRFVNVRRIAQRF